MQCQALASKLFIFDLHLTVYQSKRILSVLSEVLKFHKNNRS